MALYSPEQLRKKGRRDLGFFGVLKKPEAKRLFPRLKPKHRGSELHFIADRNTLRAGGNNKDAKISVEIHEVTGKKGQYGTVKARHPFSITLENFRLINENHRRFRGGSNL